VHTILCSAEAGQFVRLLRKLVVIREFFVLLNMPTRQQYNVRLSIDLKHICVAIRITTVIKISCLVSIEGRVYDMLSIKAEKVTITDSKLIVVLFALVRQSIADFLADVLDDDVLGVEGLTGE